MTDLAEAVTDTQNWKLVLAYDGTDFSGWQVQPGEITVQGELQSALRRVTGETPLPQGSGRTDAGVHALGQVASFPLRAPIPPGNLLRALNRTLPLAIRILDTGVVPATFHARHSAVAKTYEYRIFREAICSPFLTRYALACSWPMDVEALQKGARLFEGKHDFLSFAATDPDLASRRVSDELSGEMGESAETPRSTVREIFSSQWEPQRTEAGEFLVYRVRGSGFLHHMVRNLVGTLIDVGRGRLAAESIPEMIAARSRSAAGPTAPAQGLFLHSVEYTDERES